MGQAVSKTQRYLPSNKCMSSQHGSHGHHVCTVQPSLLLLASALPLSVLLYPEYHYNDKNLQSQLLLSQTTHVDLFAFFAHWKKIES
jgi:hypothetical protein